MYNSTMTFRIQLWRACLSITDCKNDSAFTGLLLDGSYAAWSEISRDSRRTYSRILRKRPELHLYLTRILHALTTRFKDVGYCQGMNFVAGTVLIAIASVSDPSILQPVVSDSNDDDALRGDNSPVQQAEVLPDSFMAVIGEGEASDIEVLAFRLCERLLVRNHFILMYELGLNTRLTIWTFDKLVESVFPDLHSLITQDLQVAADFYASSWFLTLFSADLDLMSSVRVLDVFIAKGAKSLYRFGLACLSIQREAILSVNVQDPADGLKVLRSAAVDAVRELGIEVVIERSFTEFKFVTNQLIADLQTAGRVHGGAKLVLFKDNPDQLHFSSLVVPLPPAGTAGDGSPSGTAFEAAWSKDQLSIRRSSLPGPENSKGFFERLRLRRTSLTNSSPVVVVAPKKEREDPGSPDNEYDDGGTVGLTGRGHSLSPEGKHKLKKSSSKISAGKAIKSFGKKLGSMLPSKSSKGYSRSDRKISAATED